MLPRRQAALSFALDASIVEGGAGRWIGFFGRN
jgi:hypothetical protein